MDKLSDGVIRYSLFSKWLQNKETAIKQYFPETEDGHIVTDWMTFGSMGAAGLEQRPLPWWLADITPADISEYRIIEEFDGVKMRGTLDKFFENTNTIVDNKCLKRKMTAKEEERITQMHRHTLEDFTSLKNNFELKDVTKYKEQLTFYQVLVEKRYGSVNPISDIEIIPVFKDLNGLIRRTGEPAVNFSIQISQLERDAMKELMIKTGKEIIMVYEAYKRGDITI